MHAWCPAEQAASFPHARALGTCFSDSVGQSSPSNLEACTNPEASTLDPEALAPGPAQRWQQQP